jgi:hypothetical protein
MANPPHLFRVDGLLDELVLRIRPWLDDVVEQLGFDPRSSYVEDLRLETLGVSAVWRLLRLSRIVTADPGASGGMTDVYRSLGRILTANAPISWIMRRRVALSASGV